MDLDKNSKYSGHEVDLRHCKKFKQYKLDGMEVSKIKSLMEQCELKALVDLEACLHLSHP